MTSEHDAAQTELPFILTSRSGATKRFLSTGDVPEWITTLRDLYKPLAEQNDNLNSRLYASVHDIENAFLQYGSDNSADRRSAFIEAANKAANNLWFPDEPRGLFLAELLSGSRRRAAGAASAWSRTELPHTTDSRILTGHILGVLFENGLMNSESSSLPALEELILSCKAWVADAKPELARLLNAGQLTIDQIKADGQSALQELSDAKTQFVEESNQLVQQSKVSIAGSLKDTENKISEFQSTITATTSKYNEELKNIKKTYDSELALQAPARFWTSKAKTHRNIAWGFAVSLALMITIFVISARSFIGTTAELYDKSSQLDQDPADTGNEVETSKPNIFTDPAALTGLALSATFVGLAFWLLRILAQNMTSHIHLATDARERSVMIVTYLSLLRRGKLSETELQTVLASIFRPSSDGMIKDENGPSPIWFEMLRKN